MIITTTDNIDGKKISEYLGIVSYYEGFLAGGTEKKRKKDWSATIDKCKGELAAQAAELNANAVVGVKTGIFRPGIGDYVYMTGTAVRIE